MYDFSVPVLIKKVASGEKTHKHLTREEARWVMSEAFAGRVTDLQLGALLSALRLKGESPEELSGFIDAVRDAVPWQVRPQLEGPIVAHCGVTGGKAHSFLAAPAAAVLAAAAGVKIVICGRTGEETRSPVTEVDVFQALGLPIDLTPEAAVDRLAETGLAVLEQRRFHPALTRLSAFRVPLGMRTVAQSLEKFVLPVRPTVLIASAFHINYIRKLAEAAATVFDFPVWLLQERDGATDLQPVHPVKGFQVAEGNVAEWLLLPEGAGLERQPAGSLPPLPPGDTARYSRGLMNGEIVGPHREMVIYNAALLIHAGLPDQSLTACVSKARDLLTDGAGRELLQRLTAKK